MQVCLLSWRKQGQELEVAAGFREWNVYFQVFIWLESSYREGIGTDGLRKSKRLFLVFMSSESIPVVLQTHK
jgi:hypothetical protein